MSTKERTAAGPPYGKQPWYAIYLAYQVVTTILLRLPLWVLYYVLPSNRPKATWSINRAIRLRLLKHLIQMASMVGPLGHTPSYLAIEDGPGVKAAGVECVRIPGYWFHRAGDDRIPGAPAKPGEKVLLALHGGAYVRHSAHPKDPTSNIATGILEATPSLSRVLTVEYRLTKMAPLQPTNPFPAALIDAVASYNYLVNELGFEPANVVVEGDSAGGNLALALVRYLVEHQSFPDVAMPATPGALILCSPWTDLSVLGYDIRGSVYSNIVTDYIDITSDHLQRIVATFAGPLGPPAAETNRYISPASISPALEVSFKDFPKTFVLSGGSEVLQDQIQVLHSRMTADMGKDVTYLELPDAVHDFLAFLWHEPERSEALEAIGLWLESE